MIERERVRESLYTDCTEHTDCTDCTALSLSG